MYRKEYTGILLRRTSFGWSDYMHKRTIIITVISLVLWLHFCKKPSTQIKIVEILNKFSAVTFRLSAPLVPYVHILMDELVTQTY